MIVGHVYSKWFRFGSFGGEASFRRLRFLSSLVVVEHKEGKVVSGTLNVVSAAKSISGKEGFVDAVVASGSEDHATKVTEEILKAKLPLRKIITITNPVFTHGMPEAYAPVIVKLVENPANYTHLLTNHSAFGKGLMPRISGILDKPQVSDITGVIDCETFTRTIYAGNAVTTVKCSEDLKLITVRATSFPLPNSTINGEEVKIEKMDSILSEDICQDIKQILPVWIKEMSSESGRPDLASARRVVSGGRALKSAENFELIYEIADKLGAAVGASRAAVDAGYADNALQVGQTGKIVAPELYIAIGISGAIQHLAGMKDSKVIVAINKDTEAPIFQTADYGLVGDLFKILPELKEKL